MDRSFEGKHFKWRENRCCHDQRKGILSGGGLYFVLVPEVFEQCQRFGLEEDSTVKHPLPISRQYQSLNPEYNIEYALSEEEEQLLIRQEELGLWKIKVDSQLRISNAKKETGQITQLV